MNAAFHALSHGGEIIRVVDQAALVVAALQLLAELVREVPHARLTDVRLDVAERLVVELELPEPVTHTIFQFWRFHPHTPRALTAG